jgi:hypothetical protein
MPTTGYQRDPIASGGAVALDLWERGVLHVPRSSRRSDPQSTSTDDGGGGFSMKDEAQLAGVRISKRIATLADEIATRHEPCAAGSEPGEVARLSFEVTDPDTLLTVECDACNVTERLTLVISLKHHRPAHQGLDAADVVHRLCRLSAEVYDTMSGESAADCFCTDGGFWSNAPENYGPTYKDGYRNDGEVLAFIEKAVRDALEMRK